MNAKKTLSLSLASAMALGLLAGCGSSASSAAASSAAASTAPAADSTSTAATANAAGKVYYLNFKPEQDAAVAGAREALHREDRRAGDRRDGRFRSTTRPR